jgi:hypothetical protein
MLPRIRTERRWKKDPTILERVLNTRIVPAAVPAKTYRPLGSKAAAVMGTGSLDCYIHERDVWLPSSHNMLTAEFPLHWLHLEVVRVPQPVQLVHDVPCACRRYMLRRPQEEPI